MTPEEHEHLQQLEATVKRYRRRIVELKALAVEPCQVENASSRTCERGVNGCSVEHERSLTGGTVLPAIVSLLLGQLAHWPWPVG